MQRGWHLQAQYLLDTKPIPVMGYKCNKSCSDSWEMPNMATALAAISNTLATNWSWLAHYMASPWFTNWSLPTWTNVWRLKLLSTTSYGVTCLPIKVSLAWCGKPKSSTRPITWSRHLNALTSTAKMQSTWIAGCVQFESALKAYSTKSRMSIVTLNACWP